MASSSSFPACAAPLALKMSSSMGPDLAACCAW
eukprot:CAMPEP_0177393854 /NCGR_PEP_ID=MMETSP0368-20130122/55193_1 /TAXON_ID=447022 ORGANISM="Scrippsiella hangoei-like, Strain SHHI-4" /NCGR_SAMPLE_ID=MMETSP0368 /ASSEMBLY_ACC=CAM_ASM_000363 /LENGTH=32 /DNA_ID= /DNA_START= /DNA_END= /DNA_ORIENTATION=